MSTFICYANGDVFDAFASLDAVLRKLIPDKRLRGYGMRKSDMKTDAERVMQAQQHSLVNSHIAITRNILIGLYSELY